MHIHSLKWADIPAVAAIAKESMAYPWSEAVFRDCFKIHYRGWVVIVNQEVIGFIIVLLHEKEAELMNIAVKPQHQHHGYAKLLLKHAIDFVKEKGVTRLLLEVRRSNQAAIRFYKKSGGEEVGSRKGYYPHDEQREDALLFSLEL